MKRLSTIMMCLFAMMAASLSAKAQEVTITLYPGWTWISYPNAEVLDMNTALGDFVPMEGDIIKSQFSNSTYIRGSWRGGVTHFMPGWGYKYYSNRTEVVSFVFGEAAPQLTVTTAEPTEITATSAISGGSITSNDGNYIYVLMKGICCSTTPNPSFNDNYVEVGNGMGSFTALMTGLTSGTTYYLRAFAVTENGTFYGNEISFTTPPEGIINSLFSINANGDQVYFSQGNLQYQASTNTWRFAENQWDYVGDGNANISSTYNGWIDLFNWGTSGYNHGANCYQPWSTSVNSSDYYAYGISTCSLNDSTGMADWGYNAISNGGNQENQWYVLSYDEWNYVLFERETSSGIRFARAKVNGFNGIIILSDNWDASNYSLNNTNVGSASYSQNSITSEDWTNFFQETAVFLPCAGNRSGTYTYNNGNGDYWSSTRKMDNDFAYDISIQNGYLGHSDNNGIFAQSVRLVRPLQVNTSYSIEATPNPTEVGSVVGFGEYLYGSICTLTATANEGYTFANWTENGEVVSTNAIYSFRVSGNRNLVANFAVETPFVPTEGLVAYYPFDGNTNDYSGNGNHGTIIGNVVPAPDRHGNPNGAYRFLGESFNFISVPDADILHLNTFTLSAWVYTDAEDYCPGSPAFRPIINKGRDVRNGSYNLLVNSVTAWNDYYGVNGAGVDYIPEVGQWHMITGTVEGDQARFYIDGVLQAEATLSHPFNCSSSDPLAIGMHYYSGVPSSWAYPFLGVIDEVRIYNRALTPQEVNSLYGSNGGCLSGVFSVSANTQVNFSQGNLQYYASTNTWRFAEHQWDYVGEDNANISEIYDGWIDLFGWGTSGYNHGANCYQPWSTSGNHADYYAYGQVNYNLYNQTGQADWGYNAIVNGGNQVGQWRTLTPQEWYYVFKQRSTVSGIRYASAKVNGVNGVILLPDNWNSSYYYLNNTNVSSASYNSNIITEAQWDVLEQFGAVFFPAAGYRIEVTLHDGGSLGLYWSSSYYNGSNAHTLNFSNGGLYTQDWCSRIYGASVRLARTVE